MKVNISDFTALDANEFRNQILPGQELTIVFPIPSIGISNSRIDIISDLCDVSYCCENLASSINVIDSKFVARDKYYLDFQISCTPKDLNKLLELLEYASKMLGYGIDDVDDEERIDFLDAVSDHEDGLTRKTFLFPDLINDYWANLINGAYWELASEYYESEEDFFRKTYKKHPEHRLGFWRSAKAKSFKDPVYFSTESWIVPPRTDLIKALQVYSGLNTALEIDDAEVIHYNGQIILLTNNSAVYFQRVGQLQNAMNCSEKVLERIFSKGSDQNQPDEYEIDLFGRRPQKRVRGKKSERKLDTSNLSFKVSDLGDLIIVNHKGYHHVFFGNHDLTFEELKELNNHLYPAYAKTQNLIANSISNKCDWSMLNDDTFEELCYDILYCHPKFDSTSIQKMGKSRSRDGGRDIVIKSRRTPTTEPELYIFQCKFLSESSSLSASKIPNAGNVIMQYGAKGYGVFTTAIIDSTLYDMLDGFSRNLNIDTSNNWSKYELERHLNRHLTIKDKYFNRGN